MSTKSKFDFFENRYNEELERARDLQKKAHLYFSLISIISSLILINLSDLKEAIICDRSILITSFIMFILLLFIVVFLFNSIRLKNYSVALNPSEYIKEVPETREYSDEDFFENRIADFIVSIEANQKINLEKAHSLIFCEYGILGLVFIVMVITLQIIL